VDSLHSMPSSLRGHERRKGNEVSVQPIPEASLAIRNAAVANIASQVTGTTTAQMAAVTAKLPARMMVGRQHSKRKSKRAYMGGGYLSFRPKAASTSFAVKYLSAQSRAESL
jgi:hypothetical protein